MNRRPCRSSAGAPWGLAGNLRSGPARGPRRRKLDFDSLERRLQPAGVAFQAMPPPITSQFMIGSVVTGDFNRDGIPDMAAGGDGIQVAIGRGGGMFEPAVTFPVPPGQIFSMTAGDFNGDGFEDLATASYASNDNVAILLGKGDGTFGEAKTATAGIKPLWIDAADFNRDGREDLVVANGNGNNATVLLGNGDGTVRFGSVVDFGAPGYASSVAVGDLNRDGVPDFVATDHLNNVIHVELGRGDGTFLDAPTVQPGKQPADAAFVAVDDFNGDGKPDIAVCNAYSKTVAVLRGNGDGTFLNVVEFPVSFAPFSLTAADFNADGIPDLAVAEGGQRSTRRTWSAS